MYVCMYVCVRTYVLRNVLYCIVLHVMSCHVMYVCMYKSVHYLLQGLVLGWRGCKEACLVLRCMYFGHARVLGRLARPILSLRSRELAETDLKAECHSEEGLSSNAHTA